MVMFTPLGRPPIWTPRPPTVPLTLSGNEITPYVRRFGREGDGLNPNELLGKYSLGVWEATTNLVTNGGFETNTTGWATIGTGTAIARSTAVAKFGAASLLVTLGNSDTFDGAVFSGLTLTDATVYTFSAWVRTVTGSLAMRIIAVDKTSTTLGTGTLTATTEWQRMSVTFTANANTPFQLRVIQQTGAASAAQYYVDGVQAEAQPLATPYVHTDGGTASRSAAALRIPATIIKRFINENTSWVAMRWKMPWASALVPTTDPRAFWWGVNDDRITMDFGATGINLLSDTTTNRVATQSGTFVAGEEITVIGAWVPATVYVSLNGAAPDTAARNGEIPDIGEAFDIGYRSDTGVSHADATLLFMAMGKGTLSSANYAALNNIARNNRIDSRPEDLPGGCTFKWPPADGDISRGFAA